MTETEWLELSYPTPMLEEAPLESERKLRLFSVACCRRVWKYIRGAEGRHAVDVAEQYADGAVTTKQLDQASEGAQRVVGVSEAELSLTYYVARRAVNASSCVLDASKLYADSVVSPGASEAAWDAADSAESKVQAELLRDIFGNPFRPTTFLPEWRTSTVLTLSQQMYESRDFSPMPILADALQDAGCTDEGILSHCRGPGPHVRGCWVVDAVLNKE